MSCPNVPAGAALLMPSPAPSPDDWLSPCTSTFGTLRLGQPKPRLATAPAPAVTAADPASRVGGVSVGEGNDNGRVATDHFTFDESFLGCEENMMDGGENASNDDLQFLQSLPSHSL